MKKLLQMKNFGKMAAIAGIMVFAVAVVVYTVDRDGDEGRQKPDSGQLIRAEELRDGWRKYSEEGLAVGFEYPGDVLIRSNEDGSVSVTRIGRTQAEGTELYDGYSLMFRTGNLAGKSLFEYVKKEQELAREQNPMGDPGAVSEIYPVTIAGMGGWQFTDEGLGVYTVMYIDLGEGEYLKIEKMSADPEGLGYEEEIEEILQSVTRKGEGVK